MKGNIAKDSNGHMVAGQQTASQRFRSIVSSERGQARPERAPGFEEPLLKINVEQRKRQVLPLLSLTAKSRTGFFLKWRKIIGFMSQYEAPFLHYQVYEIKTSN